MEERGETERRGGKGDTEAEIGDGRVCGRGLKLVTGRLTDLEATETSYKTLKSNLGDEI